MSSLSSHNIIFLFSGFLLGLVVYRSFTLFSVTGSKQQHNNAARNQEKYFLLGVTIIFSSEELKMQFLDLFTPYATYVHENEPTTLSYEVK